MLQGERIAVLVERCKGFEDISNSTVLRISTDLDDCDDFCVYVFGRHEETVGVGDLIILEKGDLVPDRDYTYWHLVKEEQP